MVIKAIGLGKGHWYKCKNGHVYAIGDCGGANQQGTCPECKEQIGGVHHLSAPALWFAFQLSILSEGASGSSDQ